MNCGIAHKYNIKHDMIKEKQWHSATCLYLKVEQIEIIPISLYRDLS